MSELRICVIGDELVAGSGDPRSLGWLGRAVARTQMPDHSYVMPLARPQESTTELVERWEAEVYPRLRKGADNRLVIGVGTHDVEAGLSVARTRLNLANIVDVAASRGIATLIVGPPPLRTSDRAALKDVAKACQEVCERRGIPFVDTYGPLEAHDQWHDDLAMSVTGLPSQAGYGLIAWIVLHRGWFEWLGLTQRS
ncbi:GDSL-type esterase/lipase family protein [Gleimia hominis]|uniref:GDSL-type esterase/lipase family protein n=1 Tax=Gleimia hominis TaxID=595468 RepID=UPI000C80B6D4|nr:GDSL-type esterase/lipase family protein [Gleimia hominis]WIK64806.1 GDSL-type esterase/lipase family protein [Gleimia hominis]